MITTLILVLFSLTATSTAVSLCDEVVETLWDFREYTELSDDQVKAIAGRCYGDYVESEERRAAAEEEDRKEDK